MDNENNNVWIDRAEYERLKALESPPVAPTPFAPPVQGTAPVREVIASSPTTGLAAVKEAPKSVSTNFLTTMTAIVAVLSFLFPPLILVLLAFGIATGVRFMRSSQTQKPKTGAMIAFGAALIAGLIFISPVIMLFAFALIWQLGCWTGLGSCTTA